RREASERLLGRAFLAFFLDYAGSVDVGHGQVVAMGQLNQFHAFRQLEVGQVNDLTDFDFRQVDFDEFRQVFRQAGNFDFGNDVGNFTAALLDANCGFLVEEVQRNVSGQLVVGDDAQEVGVHDEAFGRMALQGLDQHGFLGAIDVQGDDVAEGSL